MLLEHSCNVARASVPPWTFSHEAYPVIPPKEGLLSKGCKRDGLFCQMIIIPSLPGEGYCFVIGVVDGYHSSLVCCTAAIRPLHPIFSKRASVSAEKGYCIAMLLSLQLQEILHAEEL